MSYKLSSIAQGGMFKRNEEGHTRTLIVMVHGWRQDNTQWRRLMELADTDEKFADCDLYLFSYERGLRSKTGLDQIGAALCSSVSLYASRYDRIILIGYSIGGLIVRSAFLHALGVTGAGSDPWASKVTRIILLATPNRGLGGPGTNLYRRCLIFVTRLVSPQFLSDALKGSDFITRLRLDWVFAFRHPDIPTPEVVQLLGDKDEYIRPNDSNDVTIFPTGKLFTVANARHADLAELRDENDEKYLRIRMCCFDPIANMESKEAQVGEAPSCLVFELHGIRDYGGWLRKFAKAAEGIDPKVKMISPGYGWFSALDFIIPSRRRRRIAWFCDRYTEEVAALATADSDLPFYFVGHSYGTYLLAQCLYRFPRMHFRRVCLVGSVVNEQFPWDTIFHRHQLEGLRNDCASHDWPVGICCRVLNQLGFKDLGIGGFVGFRVGLPGTVDHLHIPGNHSATLTDDTLRQGAVEYLLLHNTADPKTVAAPRWLALASRLAVPLAIIVVLVIGPFSIGAIDQVAHSINIAPHLVVVGTIVAAILALIYI